ncbi:unnamed protein product [Schistosoma mattheei]|uniref:Uncharacterized protein n=1 Tax=Schistosoma mattheei TaxID=31246 RepID=A0A3P7YXM0_9TREM|nr:unnamed protein product [Schistosoma mattheei]
MTFLDVLPSPVEILTLLLVILDVGREFESYGELGFIATDDILVG